MKNQKRILLAVLAHPDDESFGVGGTLALYASHGVYVYLVCATRGEVGVADETHMRDYLSISEMREAELRCAARILGLKGVYFLDYRDSGMAGSRDNTHPQALAAQPMEEVANKVMHYFRLLKPQVVLTFDPIGGYRHPDHIAVQKATVHAFKQTITTKITKNSSSNYLPQRLYFHTMPRTFIQIAVRLMRLFGKDPRKFGENNDIDLVSIAEAKFPINARINIHSVMKKKEKAGACHVSQGGGRKLGGLTGWLTHLFGASETFMRAYPPVNVGEKVERDLFERVI